MHVQKSVSSSLSQGPPGGGLETFVPRRLGWAYPLYAIGVLGGLFLFFGLYLGFLAGAAYLLFALLRYEGAWSGGVLFWTLLGVATTGSAIVFLYLLKGLFKRQRADRSGYVEIREEDEPRLFAFLRELCVETGAAMPHRVYLCADVNAGVFFDSSVLSIFWPVKKNLLIGLGLVNSLNYTEFKAVLAHEFGHFSQRTMRLSNYVYLVHSVLHNMVHGRDRIDEYLARWREQFWGYLGLAWVLSGMVWVVRRTMGACLRVITVLDAALSREMEFHADRVAVEVTGSLAIVHALYKTEYAHQCMMQTYYDLHQAADRELFTSDVFYHHSRTMDFMRIAKNDPTMGIPPAEEPGVWVFDRSKVGVTSVWASHPSYAEREANARSFYVAGEFDKRSPWLLFQDPVAVRERITLALGLHGERDPAVVVEPRVVQTFIDDEHAEIIFDQKYLGMYDHRFIELGDLDALSERAAGESPDAEELRAQLENLYGEGLATFMGAFQKRIEEMRMLETVIGDKLVWGKTFVFRGEHRRPSEAPELFSKVYSEMERDRRWFGELDRAVFVHHYQIAQMLDDATREELLYRYRFHLMVQEMTRRLRALQTRLTRVLGLLNGGELSEEQIDFVFEELLQIYGEIEQELEQAQAWSVPLLNNLEQGTPLADVLMVGESLVSAEVLHAQELNSTWMREFLGQFEDILGRLSHMRRKNLGGLLFFQEEVVRQFEERLAH